MRMRSRLCLTVSIFVLGYVCFTKFKVINWENWIIGYHSLLCLFRFWPETNCPVAMHRLGSAAFSIEQHVNSIWLGRGTSSLPFLSCFIFFAPINLYNWDLISSQINRLVELNCCRFAVLRLKPIFPIAFSHLQRLAPLWNVINGSSSYAQLALLCYDELLIAALDLASRIQHALNACQIDILVVKYFLTAHVDEIPHYLLPSNSLGVPNGVLLGG